MLSATILLHALSTTFRNILVHENFSIDNVFQLYQQIKATNLLYMEGSDCVCGKLCDIDQ